MVSNRLVFVVGVFRTLSLLSGRPPLIAQCCARTLCVSGTRLRRPKWSVGRRDSDQKMSAKEAPGNCSVRDVVLLQNPQVYEDSAKRGSVPAESDLEWGGGFHNRKAGG